MPDRDAGDREILHRPQRVHAPIGVGRDVRFAKQIAFASRRRGAQQEKRVVTSSKVAVSGASATGRSKKASVMAQIHYAGVAERLRVVCDPNLDVRRSGFESMKILNYIGASVAKVTPVTPDRLLRAKKSANFRVRSWPEGALDATGAASGRPNQNGVAGANKLLHAILEYGRPYQFPGLGQKLSCGAALCAIARLRSARGTL